MFWQAKLCVGIELANSSQVNIATVVLVRPPYCISSSIVSAPAYLNIVIRSDLSMAKSCKSSTTMLLSCLWFLAVQWSLRSSSTSTPPSMLLRAFPNKPIRPRALTGSIILDVKLLNVSKKPLEKMLPGNRQLTYSPARPAWGKRLVRPAKQVDAQLAHVVLQHTSCS